MVQSSKNEQFRENTASSGVTSWSFWNISYFQALNWKFNVMNLFSFFKSSPPPSAPPDHFQYYHHHSHFGVPHRGSSWRCVFYLSVKKWTSNWHGSKGSHPEEIKARMAIIINWSFRLFYLFDDANYNVLQCLIFIIHNFRRELLWNIVFFSFHCNNGTS